MKTLLICIFAAMLCGVYAKSNVFIVYAHQEPRSFCAALKNLTVKVLEEEGHKVQVTDIYSLKFFNRINRGDFIVQKDPSYFRPQVEQAYANSLNRTNFVQELRTEYDKAIWADVFLFIYPYYLSYMPGVMQAWSERVFSYGFAFGTGGNYLKGKKAMLIYTTGGLKKYIEKYESIMQFLLHDRIKFWQMTPLDPFAAYAAGASTDEDRKKYLADLEARLRKLDSASEASPIIL